jgi:hypothetical protein
MHTHESGAPPVAPSDAAEVALVVSVDTEAPGIAGDVLGPDGVTQFDGHDELTAALRRAVSESAPA